jgi:uncharacterized protein (DUF1499 family)
MPQALQAGKGATTVPKWLLRAIAALAGLVLMALLTGLSGLLTGRPPGDLGVRDGKLKPPSQTDNSVSSQAGLWSGHAQREAAHIDPLPLVGGDGAATMRRLREIVADMPGTQVLAVRDDYLHVQFTTPLMKFGDDAEFWLDTGAGVVQVRSASRLGRRDFGVNRRRIEAIRVQLAEVPQR